LAFLDTITALETRTTYNLEWRGYWRERERKESHTRQPLSSSRR